MHLSHSFASECQQNLGSKRSYHDALNPMCVVLNCVLEVLMRWRSLSPFELWLGKKGSKNPGFFFKKPNPVGFIGFWGFIGFFGQAGKNR